MGIPSLWPALAPCMERKSLSEMLLQEQLMKTETKQGCVNIGIDAAPLLYSVQNSLIAARKKGASLALTGPDTEMKMMMERLGFWHNMTANIGFFFDGPNVPKEKRGKQVRFRAHGFIATFKDLVAGYNFKVVEAPGEAEAELAHLNRIGVLDHVVSTDSDLFLFGATSVIRSPQDTQNRDSVELYTQSALLAHDPDRLSRPGILLTAVVGGADYNSGLEGCGFEIAFSLAKSDLANSLWRLAHSQASGDELETERVAWREKLRDELATNRSGLLSRRQPAASKKIPGSFPNLEVVRQYARPVTTKSQTVLGLPSDLHFWSRPTLTVPNTSALTSKLCDFFPDWHWGRVLGQVEEYVMTGHLTRQMIDIKEARSLRRPQGLGFASVHQVDRIDKALKHKSSAYPYYRVQIWPFFAANQAFDAFLAKHRRDAKPGEVVTSQRALVSIPGPILERAMPEKVDLFYDEHPAQARPNPEYWRVLQSKIHAPQAQAERSTMLEVIDIEAGGSEPAHYIVRGNGGREVLEICDDD